MERRTPGVFREDRPRSTTPGAAELVHLAAAPQHWLCGICRDSVQHEPVITPCGHSFCKNCLAKLLSSGNTPSTGSGVRGRCPMCRSLVPVTDAARPNEPLRKELARHSLACSNAGCTAPPVCARYWRQHQDECLFAEVVCKHGAHGCLWRGTRQDLPLHLESCPFHALRAYLNKTNQQIHHLRHLCMHFETALGHAGQQLASLRQWRNGNVAHYAEFLWSTFAEPHTYDASLPRWRSSLDVVFLETLLIAAPLLAVQHALLCGALPAAPICRLFGPEVSPLLGSAALEQQCNRAAGGPGGAALYGVHALASLLFVAAVLLDGWASPRGWRLRWSQPVVVMYAAALAPVLVAHTRLLCAILGVYMLQFALEAITGHHRFVRALHRGCLLSACWFSRRGVVKAVLVGALWLCNSAVDGRLVGARRALGRPVRLWCDAVALLRAAASASTGADAARVGAGLALVAACLATGQPAELLLWFANLLLVLWGGSFGLRWVAASLLQLALDTRGKNAVATVCCRALLALASLSALYIVRRCVLTAAVVV